MYMVALPNHLSKGVIYKRIETALIGHRSVMRDMRKQHILEMSRCCLFMADTRCLHWIKAHFCEALCVMYVFFAYTKYTIRTNRTIVNTW